MLRHRTLLAAIVPLFGLSSTALAADVPIDKAKPVAENWLTHSLSAQKMTGNAHQIIKEEVISVNGQTVGYNYLLSPAGHIIVPSRDELPVVKLYSLTSTMSMDDNSEAVEWIKDELFKLNQAIDAHASDLAGIDNASTHNGQLWSRFGKDAAAFAHEAASGPAESIVILGPLLHTTWNQTAPYNGQTPLWYNGTATYTGCVATAAAQIMRYWRWPAAGDGSTSYLWNNGSSMVTLSTNFSSSSYDWANMLNNYTGAETTVQRNAVAKLMSDVGVAFHMNYGYVGSISGSGASTMYGTTVYPTYFGYKNTIQGVYRTSYGSDSAWMQVFRNELLNNRPSQLRIRDPWAGGHSIVVDGYMDTPSEQIHLNLGWSGSYDGWYVSNNIVTGGYDWSDVNYQGALIGIEPDVVTVNQPPTVNAGLDQTITLPASANLAGTVTDDGLPNPPGMVTDTWSKVSGPGTVTFANASAAVTTATFSVAGTYVLRLAANDGLLSASDDVTITVLPEVVRTPCSDLCAHPVTFTIAPYGSYQSGNLGTGAICRETVSPVHGGNCGNMAGSRRLMVNGTTMPCNNQNWASLPPARNGGYCYQTTPGDYPWAFFTAW